jgi:uncharacterized repeat protein (TIGR01451 family)
VTSAGPYAQGSQVVYTVVLTNNGGTTQQDNAGNEEFLDILPAGLTLPGATAASGTAVANTGTNTVTWNGSLAPGASVTITITAAITAAPGTTISNQGTISYDSNGDGTNDATRLTDDATVAGTANPTNFVVGAPATAVADVPLASPMVLLLMTAMLGLAGVVLTRRR